MPEEPDLTNIPEVPVPANAGRTSMADLAKTFMQENPPDDAPVVPAETTPPVVENTEKPTEPVPVKPTGAAARLDQQKAELKRQAEEQKAAWEKEKAAWDEERKGLAGRLTEFETLAEQRAREKEEALNLYKNESSLLDVDPMQLAPVKEAAMAANNALKRFLPTDLSATDESPHPVNVGDFLSNNMSTLNDAVRDWQELAGAANMPAAGKGKLQHLILSNLGTALGIDERHFSEEVINGQNLKLLNPGHPAFQQMKNHMPDLVERTKTFKDLRDGAQSAPVETARQVITNRKNESVQAMRQRGIGLTGDALQQELRKRPEDPNLLLMSIAEKDPQLLKEIDDEVEVNAILDGHMRRKFDIPELDPAARDKTGRMLQQRFEDRARNAPLVKPLQKAFVRVLNESKTKDAEIERLKNELAGYTAQGEIMGSADHSTGTKPVATTKEGWKDPFVQKYLEAV